MVLCAHLYLAVISNVLLLTSGLVYQIFFGAFVLGLLVAIFKIVPSGYYFLLMNFAMLKGFFMAFGREKSGGWAREARSDDEA